MKTLSDLCPEIHPNQLQLIWREIEASLPGELKSWYGQYTMQLESQVHNNAIEEVKTALAAFIGGIE